MNPRPVLAAALLLLVSAAHSQQDAPRVKVEYVVDVREAAKGAVWVDMTVRHPPDDLKVAIPVWRPGTYRLQDYPQRVREIAAAGAKLETLDAQTWRVPSGGRDTTIRYRLSPDAEDVRGHAFIEGPATYLYAVDHKDAPCTVRFVMPDGWKAATGLDDLGDGLFGARDYDTFADCPAELGVFDRRAFETAGATWEFVVHSDAEYDGRGLETDLRELANAHARFFGGVPFKRYVFIFHFRDDAEPQGLEHLNSTAITLDSEDLSQGDVLDIASHELFHAWNVKRLRPKELGPFDYAQPVRTKALWFCEGVTQYYGDLLRHRAGLLSEEGLFYSLAWNIRALQRNDLRRRTSVEESSRTVWDRKDPHEGVDYYGKGMLIGWLLDLTIRVKTSGVKSLDDVMRSMYQTYVTGHAKQGKGPIGTGYAEDAIAKAASEVAGCDLSEFFRRYVSGTDELPYAEVATKAGLAVRESDGDWTIKHSPDATEAQRRLIDDWLNPRRK